MLVFAIVTILSAAYVGGGLKLCWQKSWLQPQTYWSWKWGLRIAILFFLGVQVCRAIWDSEWGTATFAIAVTSFCFLLFLEVKVPEQKWTDLKQELRSTFRS